MANESQSTTVTLPREEVETLIGQLKELKADMYTIVDQFKIMEKLIPAQGKKFNVMQLLANPSALSGMGENIATIKAITGKYDAHRNQQQ